MGLDITAYRGLRKIDCVFDEDGGPIDPTTRDPIDDYLKVYANEYFPGRESPLEDRAVYSYEDAEHVFSRGYGAYNRWREVLAEMAGYPLTVYKDDFGSHRESHAAACWNGATGPFSELINFADNEGVIGSDAAAKLLRDFIEFDERAKEIDEPYFYDGYTNIRHGLELAADGGALDFH